MVSGRTPVGPLQGIWQNREPPIVRNSCHVELTTLIVPGENDSLEEMAEEARWIAGVNPEIPLHITRFFPQYHMLDRKPTDIRRLYQLAETAGQYLANVYVGNVS